MDQQTGPADPTERAAAQPVDAASRLVAMDVARGIALLGIFFVNIQLFAMPFGTYMQRGPESDDALTTLCYYFVKIFCEAKFYTLFSTLFGMGLVLQMHSVIGRGGSFYAVYARRLLWLLAMGLLHALLLWYGDILFVYGLCGIVLLLCARAGARVLLGVGAGLVLFGAVALAFLMALDQFGQSVQQTPIAAEALRADAAPAEAPTDAPPPIPNEDESSAAPDGPGESEAHAAPPVATDDKDKPRSPIVRLFRGFEDGSGRQPNSATWMDAETEAYRDGPYLQAFLFRAMSWGMMFISFVFGFGWHVLGMFFIGAGLLKAGLLSPTGAAWQARLALLGALVGVPIATASALLSSTPDATWWGMGLSALLLMISGPLVALMYLCTVAIIVRNGVLAPVTWVLANVGRMALTNYIMQTLVATFVFYHWGLAQFGSWSRPERCALVLAVFAAQCVISPLWLSVFRFGPLEWVWRSVTYLKPQPMLRTAGQADHPEPVS
ncbi:MAG: DUF418 domain-containing protein [Phycisphaeraceae bacterium]|nr:DUF418 domain-containing protein [Phycisphaeraceae bacterium]